MYLPKFPVISCLSFSHMHQCEGGCQEENGASWRALCIRT